MGPVPAFIFATGIENSNPTIEGGRVRRDEMEECGHTARWREDFALVEELGLQFLRYGPPLHRTWLGPAEGGAPRCDWEFADATFRELMREVRRELGALPGGSGILLDNGKPLFMFLESLIFINALAPSTKAIGAEPQGAVAAQ